MKKVDLRRTTSADENFQALVCQLDSFLAVLNGEDHDFYSQHNRSDSLGHVVVAVMDGAPVGCGAFRPMDESVVEIKRMFVLPEHRGTGVARKILLALEEWAQEERYSLARLETSKRLLPAVGLYQRMGYEVIPNFGPYVDVEDSVCLERALVKP